MYTRSSLYCPLNYYDEPIKDQHDVIRTHKGSIDFQDVIENFYIKLIACDVLLIYLSSTLVSLAIPRGLLSILYFTLSLFGDVATMAVISCNQSHTIYSAICYKFAHIGLGYLTVGWQIASVGNDDIFELKEHLLWLSILFNLICFTPNKSNFVVLMSIMSSFFAVCWEISKMKKECLTVQIGYHGTPKLLICSFIILSIQFIRNVSPIASLVRENWNQIEKFYRILDLMVLCVTNYVASTLSIYLNVGLTSS